jgi:hypothetical protein
MCDEIIADRTEIWLGSHRCPVRARLGPVATPYLRDRFGGYLVCVVKQMRTGTRLAGYQ